VPSKKEPEVSSLFEVLKTLTEMPGLSGNENLINGYLQERWKPHAQEIMLTSVGNLVAHIGGEGPKAVITAHADEHGFLVKSISQDGFLFLDSTRSGLRPPPGLYAVGQPALILGRQGRVEGIFATVTGHVMSAQQREKKEVAWGDLFIDVGAESQEEVLTWGITVGCPVVWNPPTRRLGRLICGKAMDDRMGLAVMDELLRSSEMGGLQYDLYLASTVQEELGMVGARSLSQVADFDLALCLDCGMAGDIPLVDERDMPVKLGGGPVLVHKDAYVHYSPRLTATLGAVAEKAGIPVQHAVFPSYASDGAELIRQGIETALIAPPMRYTHSPFETVHEDDLRKMVQLLKAFLESKA
jgi:putative aminopeptidase FrvX